MKSTKSSDAAVKKFIESRFTEKTEPRRFENFLDEVAHTKIQKGVPVGIKKIPGKR